MAPRSVTAKALQALLARIGSASSGTKDVLQARFRRDVVAQHLFALPSSTKGDPHKQHGKKLRIVSIDMGIKNLAFCDVEMEYSGDDSMNPTLDIIRWDKLNLLDTNYDLDHSQSELRNSLYVKDRVKDAEDEQDPYSLPVLSRTAYTFLRKSVLEVSPDIILIERQRWRSGGSSAIQQWTVRVNTLEAMLWAILNTLNLEQSATSRGVKGAVTQSQYGVHGVDPKRVGQYWLGQQSKARAERPAFHEDALNVDVNQIKKEARSKAEKKAKIAILRSWFSTKPASTQPSTPASAPILSFTVGLGATAALNALSLPSAKTRRKKKADIDDQVVEKGLPVVAEKDLKKLDDITDSCLQVAAWVAWESTRRQLYEVWERKRGKDGKMPELDDEVLREMLNVIGE
ncbi:mitochondrial resolvase Ydc2 [Paraphoma chrysanthemicola]|uniref:Mitochondrial resolvase Ydc2 n=1 Tax=Paraphoma chrysanthemicola TaxID=798071 RepID=A0A8K0W3X5_9PLEO|nr:mitochondrial resolvase Ydc2 [Paraphoma chrysanthemicola]